MLAGADDVATRLPWYGQTKSSRRFLRPAGRRFSGPTVEDIQHGVANAGLRTESRLRVKG